MRGIRRMGSRSLTSEDMKTARNGKAPFSVRMPDTLQAGSRAIREWRKRTTFSRRTGRGEVRTPPSSPIVARVVSDAAGLRS